MSFLDKIKQKAEDLDLETKAKELAEAAAKAAQQAKEKAGEIAHEQRDKVEEVLDKAGHAIDEKTEGKYHDKVAKAKDTVVKGVDKIAEQRVAAPGDGPEAGPYFDADADADAAPTPAGGPDASGADETVMSVDPAVGDEAVSMDEGLPDDGPIAGPADDETGPAGHPQRPA